MLARVARPTRAVGDAPDDHGEHRRDERRVDRRGAGRTRSRSPRTGRPAATPGRPRDSAAGRSCTSSSIMLATTQSKLLSGMSYMRSADACTNAIGMSSGARSRATSSTRAHGSTPTTMPDSPTTRRGRPARTSGAAAQVEHALAGHERRPGDEAGVQMHAAVARERRDAVLGGGRVERVHGVVERRRRPGPRGARRPAVRARTSASRSAGLVPRARPSAHRARAVRS